MHATTRDGGGQAHGTCSVMIHGSFADDNLMRRVRGEFGEMPGMRLTLDQACRLWTLDHDRCAAVLERLVAGRFLEVDGTGRYRKAHGGY